MRKQGILFQREQPQPHQFFIACENEILHIKDLALVYLRVSPHSASFQQIFASLEPSRGAHLPAADPPNYVKKSKSLGIFAL